MPSCPLSSLTPTFQIAMRSPGCGHTHEPSPSLPTSRQSEFVMPSGLSESDGPQ